MYLLSLRDNGESFYQPTSFWSRWAGPFGKTVNGQTISGKWLDELFGFHDKFYQSTSIFLNPNFYTGKIAKKDALKTLLEMYYSPKEDSSTKEWKVNEWTNISTTELEAKQEPFDRSLKNRHDWSLHFSFIPEIKNKGKGLFIGKMSDIYTMPPKAKSEIGHLRIDSFTELSALEILQNKELLEFLKRQS